jgi:hypothetical protein
MNPCTLVTEDESDRRLLETLLDINKINRPIKIIAAGGWSSADSLARSILVHDEDDVALVVDADSTDPNLAEERQRFLQKSLDSMSYRSAWQVFVIVPQIEVLLFADRQVLEALVGHPVSDTDLVHGAFEPQKVLRELLGGKPLLEYYRGRLPKMDLSRIRSQSPLPELDAFLKGTGETEERPRPRRQRPRLTSL